RDFLGGTVHEHQPQAFALLVGQPVDALGFHPKWFIPQLPRAAQASRTKLTILRPWRGAVLRSYGADGGATSVRKHGETMATLTGAGEREALEKFRSEVIEPSMTSLVILDF